MAESDQHDRGAETMREPSRTQEPCDDGITYLTDQEDIKLWDEIFVATCPNGSLPRTDDAVS